MTTKRQLANLKRGGAPATPESAARAREAKARHEAEDERLGQVAAEDPHSAYEELHGVMARQISKLLRVEERRGGDPSRNVTDRLREFRQLTEALAEYRRAQGAVAEAEQFFTDLSARLAAGTVNLGEKLRPYLAPGEDVAAG
jgi:hypothetical protein